MDVTRSALVAVAILAPWRSGSSATTNGERPMDSPDLDAEMARIVQAALPGATDLQRYGRDDLHKYINGAAERYLGYSFDRLVVSKAEQGEDAFAVELYHFSAPGDPYGIWSADCIGERVSIGQSSAYGGGLLQFWRGSYFARVYHHKYVGSAREAVLELGRNVAASIGQDGRLPELLAELPREAVKGEPVFFHEQPMLNHLYYLSDQNLLGLGPKTDAVFATYEHEGAKAKLLVVRYEKAEDAAAARKALVEEYMAAKPARGPLAAQLENELWTAVGEPTERTLRVALDASSRDLALKLVRPPGID